MQRYSFGFDKIKSDDDEYRRQNSRRSKRSLKEDDIDPIDNICLLLSKGDITKRDDIMWGFTYNECKPFLKYMEREILFREAVIGTLIDESKTQSAIEEQYCYACKLANKDVDCSKCSKDIKTEKKSEDKTIGR